MAGVTLKLRIAEIHKVLPPQQPRFFGVVDIFRKDFATYGRDCALPQAASLLRRNYYGYYIEIKAYSATE
jgi:hypothetical protein